MKPGDIVRGRCCGGYSFRLVIDSTVRNGDAATTVVFYCESYLATDGICKRCLHVKKELLDGHYAPVTIL
jgi:hypothetical protein